MSKRIKVLVAEDHKVVREGLRILIASDPSMEIAGEAETGEEAIAMARELRPDVVLMDLAMPKLNGFDAAKQITKELPTAKVLVLSAFQDDETVRRAMETGASGFMTKHSAAAELLQAIRLVGEGRKYYSRRIAERLETRSRVGCLTGRSRITSASRLTQREQEVLGLIAQGFANKQIAYDLGLSIKTVEKHRQALMDKLGLHDTASLTRYVMCRQLLVSAPTEPVTSAAQRLQSLS